jgi:hypothetical protein
MEETTSKKGAKKAEAKAKKEAEKARKAAEREAAAASSSSAANIEDLAKENYGDIKTATGLPAGEFTKLEQIGEEHVGKTVKLRDTSRIRGCRARRWRLWS